MRPPTIGYLSDIYFGPDTVQLLPELLDHLNIQHPLIATDKGLVSMGLIAGLPSRPGITAFRWLLRVSQSSSSPFLTGFVLLLFVLFVILVC